MDKKRSFVYGAALLGISGVIVKVLGAVFRIPLVSVIGSEGMGYYNMAFPIYSLLIVISTAGLPVAVSKMVAERMAKGDMAGAKAAFTSALKMLIVMGSAVSAGLFLFSGFISNTLFCPK